MMSINEPKDMKEALERIKELERQVNFLKDYKEKFSGIENASEDRDDDELFAKWFNIYTEEKMIENVEILNNKVVRENFSLKEYSTYQGEQWITVRYVAIIPVDEIEINPFSEDRKINIRKWLDEKRLSRMFYCFGEDNRIRIAVGFLPSLYRYYKYNEQPSSYQVADGQHRIAVAREKGITHILANISDTIVFRKTTIDF